MMRKSLLRKIINQKKMTGFSLVELSVVILVISFLVVEGVSLFSGSLVNNKSAITSYRTNLIYSAIKDFISQNKRLPCPAPINQIKSTSITYGKEGDCSAVSGITVSGNLIYGMVPVVSLGLGSEIAEDGYGAKFVYVVDKTFTTASDPSPFKSNNGAIAIKKYIKVNGQDILTDEENNAIFAIISYGPNQNGAFSSNSSNSNSASDDSDEITNSILNPGQAVITQSSRSTKFDDMVFFKNKSDFLVESQSYFLKDTNVGSSASGSYNGSSTTSASSGYSCYLTGRSGVTNRMLQDGSEVISCNAANYTGQISYSCTSGILVIKSSTCTCVTGYTGASCTACASGYTMVNGVCHKNCTLQNVDGITSREVNAGTDNVYCNVSGYNPANYISYSCLNGQFSYNGSCNSCASGYSSYNGTCYPNCSTGSTNGITTRTVNAGFGEINCDVTGYDPSDSISYTCISGSFTVTNSTACDRCSSGYKLYNGSCSSSCSSFSITGVTQTSVESGSGTLQCDDTNFTGSVSYVCGSSNPSFTYTGSCSCKSGYYVSNGVCKKDCPVSVEGSTSTSVHDGEGSITCDQPRYSGNISYNCANGATITGTCSCQTGYTGANCYYCSAGYYFVNNACVQACQVNVVGSTTKSVNYGIGSITCDSKGYTGSIPYNCSNSSQVITGTCSCDTGYSGENCSVCSSGYQMVNGVCRKSCSVSVQGVASPQYVVVGSSSLSCNQTGYSGSIAYTCSSGGVFSTNDTCSCASGYISDYGDYDSDGITNECIAYSAPFCSAAGSFSDISTSSRKIIKFSGSSNFICTSGTPVDFKILVVGGGGNGSGQNAGGGGRVVYVENVYLTKNKYYQVSVGNAASDSYFKTSDALFNIYAPAGGRGAAAGGSNGGCVTSSTTSGIITVTRSSNTGIAYNLGNVGGACGSDIVSSVTRNRGGGGGGAGAAGSQGSNGVGGQGGAGYSITITGSSAIYGSGGGACGDLGGASGGQNAGSCGNSALDGYGGGGGGNNGSGAKGVVIISYPK